MHIKVDEDLPQAAERVSSTEDPRLSKLSAICLGFPETTRTDSGRHATFLVRKKTFAYFLDDHHGDGIVSVCCKMGLGRMRRSSGPIRRGSISPPTSRIAAGSR